MLKPLLASATTLVVSAALAGATLAADTCGRWQASVSSLSGEGRAFNARVCMVGKPAFGFEITCRGPQALHLRFLAESPNDVDFSNKTLPVAYRIDGTTHTLPSQFEGLDGAFTANVAVSSPLIAALKSGSEVVATIPGTPVPEHRIPLSGSRTALDRLIARCAKG